MSTNYTPNPNKDKDKLDSMDIENENNFPFFLKKIRLNPFRHINNLTIEFRHPISVISGINKSGKSTILMAIACSHYEFKKRNPQNGNLDRYTWSALMQFTNGDLQNRDWTYYITYKQGKKLLENKRGQRKGNTGKWNGIAKKQGQFNFRDVVFIDLDRVSPARNFSKVIFNRTKRSNEFPISEQNTQKIEDYLSYIFEQKFSLNKLATYQDKDIFKYKDGRNQYSSYNAAAGEEVLIKIIIDTVEAKEKSLILIDEIEVGLHPKIQRKLIQVLYHIAINDHKQFILTTHSQTILASVPEKSRIFIERDYNGNFKSIPDISINVALSKMDSETYPLVELYCEDETSCKIINKAIEDLRSREYPDINNLISIMISGAANKTYDYYMAHKETNEKRKLIKVKCACILDGDMKKQQNFDHNDSNLHFLYSEENPEVFLVKAYHQKNPNANLSYHIENSDNHCLFGKLVELGVCQDTDKAFELCWDAFISTNEGKQYLEELEEFLIKITKEDVPSYL